MKQTIEIEVPDGKIAIWKDNKVIFEDIKPRLPKTWEEFCKMKKPNKSEAYINNGSECVELGDPSEKRLYQGDRNILPNKKAAEAHLALMQLHQLRDCWREGWLPDWKNFKQEKYVIVKIREEYGVRSYNYTRCFLSFQDEKRAEEFLTNFRELIEKAGDLV